MCYDYDVMIGIVVLEVYWVGVVVVGEDFGIVELWVCDYLLLWGLLGILIFWFE